MVQFPPFAGGELAIRGGEVVVRGGEVAVRGGVAPKVQTTSVKNADNGVSWARWSALWAKAVSDMVCRSHANLLVRALTGYIARKPALRM